MLPFKLESLSFVSYIQPRSRGLFIIPHLCISVIYIDAYLWICFFICEQKYIFGLIYICMYESVCVYIYICAYTYMCMYKHYYIMYNILPYNGHGAKQWSLYFANVYKKLVDMDVIWALGYPKGTSIFSLLDDTSSYWFSCSYTNSWDMFIAVLQVVHRSWVSHEVRGLFLCFYIFEYLGRLPVYVVGCRNRNMIIVLLLGHRQRKNIRDMWRH